MSNTTPSGTVIAAGRAQEPEAEVNLIRLTEDPLAATIVRATALEFLDQIRDRIKIRS